MTRSKPYDPTALILHQVAAKLAVLVDSDAINKGPYTIPLRGSVRQQKRDFKRRAASAAARVANKKAAPSSNSNRLRLDLRKLLAGSDAQEEHTEAQTIRSARYTTENSASAAEAGQDAHPSSAGDFSEAEARISGTGAQDFLPILIEQPTAPSEPAPEEGSGSHSFQTGQDAAEDVPSDLPADVSASASHSTHSLKKEHGFVSLLKGAAETSLALAVVPVVAPLVITVFAVHVPYYMVQRLTTNKTGSQAS